MDIFGGNATFHYYALLFRQEADLKQFHQIHSRLRNNTVQFFLLINEKTDLLREDASCLCPCSQEEWVVTELHDSKTELFHCTMLS